MRLEPEWWAEARKLKAEGYSTKQIAKKLGRHKRSVEYVVYPKVRENRINQSKEYYKKGYSKGNDANRDYKRDYIRRNIREICWGKPVDLRQKYQEYNCL